jgi:hypothetical protein
MIDLYFIQLREPNQQNNSSLSFPSSLNFKGRRIAQTDESLEAVKKRSQKSLRKLQPT